MAKDRKSPREREVAGPTESGFEARAALPDGGGDPGATRQRLLDAAMQLFWRKGYNSTSVADVLEKAGANSGSLYHFFPTKQALLVAVLDRYVEGLYPMLFNPVFERVADPIERIFGVLDVYRESLLSTDLTYGCPIGSLALELHEPDPEVRVRLATNFANWAKAIERGLEEAGDRLPADLDRRALSIFILTTMEGGVMQSRTHRSIEPFDACVAQLRAYVDRLLESGRRARPVDPSRKEVR